MDKEESELAKSIGAAARQARLSLNLTQDKASELINVSVEFYARIERGNALPSVPTFKRIVEALQVSPDTLLGLPLSDPDIKPVWYKSKMPVDGPEIGKINALLSDASATTLRIVNMLLKELEKNSDPR